MQLNRISKANIADLAQEDQMNDCTCKSAKAIFYCDQKIPCNKNQIYFCMMCLNKHPH
jgi:hypothetical protein